MKIVFCLLFLVSSVSLAQEYKPYNTFNKEAELQRFVAQGGKVEEISPNIYRLTNIIGESRTFYLGSKEDVNGSMEYVDTTILNIWEIDTIKFNNMFRFWQKVEVANSWWTSLPTADLNNNNRPELYGYTDIIYPNLIGPVKIFERNLNGNYENIFSYDFNTSKVDGITDINRDGIKEMIILSIIDEDSTLYYHPIFKSDTVNSLPSTFDLFLNIDSLDFPFDLYQIYNMVFGDWNNNGKTECAFTTIGTWDTTMCMIAEYNDSINNFEKTFQFSSIYESDLSGFAINDFDQDEKTELVISSGPGNVFVIENISENQYSIINQFPFPIHNTYMQTVTNDIDENGKPEFWIGGQDYVNGITVFQCYEFDGDNNYQVVAYIELRYLVSLFNEYIQAVDIDDDKKEELIISIGNVILILKFGGFPNNHQYKLWYAKLGESTQPGAQFYPVSIADLDGDSKKDLLIPMEKYTSWITYAFSYILRSDGTSSIEFSESNKFFLEEYIKSYPVPFNSYSSIRFAISDESLVKIKVYSALGKEIKTLLEEQLSPGEYDIHWEAKDKYGKPLTSGIYFISLQTKNVVKTIKTILLK
ncbi:MAG: T9SS type A sorting domain-containing protein [Ignavibacteriaceae bacterium]|nr:T9SS type A sorting domain-containing protein [Ignavibacteriaceae bacterium]